jgi:hypothetical protein
MSPRRTLALTSVLAAALAAAGCKNLKAVDTKAESAERPEVEFTHSIHVDQGVECTQCHANIEKSTSLEDKNLPASTVCTDCHDAKEKKASPPEPAESRLTFSHAKHLPQVKNKCDTCHKKLPEPGEPREVPPMAVCTGCHKHQKDFQEARCTPCHVDLKSYDLVPRTAFSHAGGWLAAHGALAKGSAQTCAACHDQTYCADCHDAQTTPMRQAIRFPEEVQREFIHRGDYVSRHMIEAQANPASCARCHGTPFCQSCHELQGVAQPTVTRNPHPTGWADGSQHGVAARNNILSCAGCHDQGANSRCMMCHSAQGGPQINPHPPSFLKKHDEPELDNPVCRTCHG